MSHNPLNQAPPRLSDLHGDERTQALNARGAAHRQHWLETRERLPLLMRIVDRIERIFA